MPYYLISNIYGYAFQALTPHGLSSDNDFIALVY